MKRLGALSVLLCLYAVGAFGQTYWGQRLPKQPENFVFGYGSLVSSSSRAATLPSQRVVVPARISADFGYLRCWCSPADSGFMAMGIRKPSSGEKPGTINGVIFPVAGDEMKDLDNRESDYDRVEIPRAQIESVSWQGLPPLGKIWIYVPKDKGTQQKVAAPSSEYPILQSYIDVVVEGGLEFSVDFAKEIVATTADWNNYWLNDRELPRRPWVRNKMASPIDRVLKSTEQSAKHYGARVVSAGEMRGQADDQANRK